MQALIFERFGTPDVLTWADIADPALPAGHALIGVHAAGLNYADVYRRQGRYTLDATPPWILGYEAAGVILALADDAPGFQVGDRVCVADWPRANATRMAVPIDRLIPIPDMVSTEDAAAVILQGLTAQYLIEDSARIEPGATVLIHAAAGGVGLLLTGLLVHRGARVFGLASTADKRAAALAAGAEVVFDSGGDWRAELQDRLPHGVDVVYDSVGSTLGDSLRAARTGGTVVFYGFAGGDPPPIDPRVLMDRSLTLTGGDLWNVLTNADIRRRRAAALFERLQAGDLRPVIAARFPMSRGADAHRLLESRTAIGKILLIADSAALATTARG